MKPITTAPFYNIETLQSRNGLSFLSFAKSRKFQKELYEDLVAPYYNSGDYYVETWRHGGGNIESDCTKPSKVYNIEQVKFKAANITFKTLRDHSKWMVSEEKKLICIGDINRQVGRIQWKTKSDRKSNVLYFQEHQKVRGGGTVCLVTKMSLLYGDLINEVEKCKKSGTNFVKASNSFVVY